MKIQNKMNDIRQLLSLGRPIEFGPKEIKDVERPIFNEMVFEKVDIKKSKEKPTLSIAKNEKLNKENN